MDDPFRNDSERFSISHHEENYDGANANSSRRSTLPEVSSFMFQASQPHHDRVRASRPRPRSCPAVPRFEPPSLSSDHPSTPSFRFMDLSHTLKRRSAVSTSTFRELDADQTKRRKVITSRQFDRLVEVFAESDTPSLELRDRLGAELGMSSREVQVWFQNRRAKVKRERQIQSSGEGSISQSPPKEKAKDEQASTTPRLKWRPYIVSPIIPSDSTATTDSTSDRNQLPPPASFCSPSTARSHSFSEIPRYRKVFGDQRISIPFPSLDPSTASSPLSAASSATSYFGTRVLPSPSGSGSEFTPATTRHGSCDSSSSTRLPPSPWTAFAKLSLNSPSPFSAERDPFFPHNRSERSSSQEEEAEPIHLAPIVEFVVSSTSSLVSGPSRAHFTPSKSIHHRSRSVPSSPCPTSPALQPRGTRSRRPSLELLLNPVFSTPPSPLVGRIRSGSLSSLETSGSRAGDVDENFGAVSSKTCRLSLPSIPSLFGSI